MFIKIEILILCIIFFIGGAAAGKDIAVDVGADVVPAELSRSELDAWISQNQDNFDFYIEGRTLAEYYHDTQRKILQARKEAQLKVERIEARLEEQLTGSKAKDRELIAAAKSKKNKVYREEMAREEQLLARQLRREVAIMRSRKFKKHKIADIQKEFRAQIAQLKKDPVSRISAAAANMPAIDPELSQDSSGKRRIKIDRQHNIMVEHTQYGGEMSDRAKRRLRSR